jgi:hypothetical protein
VQFTRNPGENVSQWFPNYGSEGARFSCSVISGAYQPGYTDYAAPLSATGLGQFFGQTNFWVRDGVVLPDGSGRMANFFSQFNRMGGASTLGYPISRPYWKDGFAYQAFQRGIIQWRPEIGVGVLANTMDWLYAAGYDNVLSGKGIPRHITDYDGCGSNLDCAKSVRLAWMTDPDIAAAYFGVPGGYMGGSWDPINFYGLPTSRAEMYGPYIVQRFQRYGLQKWINQVMGMPEPGTITGILVGELAKEAGLVPSFALAAEAP